MLVDAPDCSGWSSRSSGPRIATSSPPPAPADDASCLPPVAGGATRQASVRAGLEALAPHKPDIVLIHDAARPFASRQLIARAIAAARRDRCGDPGAAGHRHRQDASMPTALSTRRSTATRCALVQTPQAFAFAPLLEAHRRAARARPRRLHRRRRARRMGRHEGRRVRGRGGQHQDHHTGGFRARRGAAVGRARRCAHRHRLRRARLRRRRSCHRSAASASRTARR